MDTALHCNDLKCRATVTDRAVVTTCSHIFCLPCADRLDLSAPKDGQRKCPACGTFLLNLDDAVVASLNPTEDYKTSILSGLSPTVIMECAGRGLSFWAYQMAQEITYQEYLSRSLADRYTSLSAHVEAMTRDVQEESNKMASKLEAVHAENADLVERYNTLEKKYKQKSQSEKDYRELYSKLKVQATGPRLASAAEHEVEEHIQRAANTQQDSPQGYTRDNNRRSGSNGSAENRNSQRQHSSLQNPPYGHSQPYGSQPVHSRAGLTTANSASQAPPPASQNRQHLPTPAFGQYNNSIIQNRAPDPIRGQTPLRGHTAASYQGGSPAGAAPGISANARYGRPLPGHYSQAAPPGSRAGVIGTGRPGYLPSFMRS